MTSRLMQMSESVETRETRGFAFETKFVVDPLTARLIRDWARVHMAADQHGHGPWSDEYRITSLYFDTAAFDVLTRQGSFGRAKYRVRRYGAEPFVFLERKLRTKMLLAKRRTRVSLDDLDLVTDPADAPLAWRGDWFRRRIARRQLQPACQVSYQRIARVSASDFGPVRLTLDNGLQAVPAAGLGFFEGSGRPVVESEFILELKHRLSMPAVFKRLIEEFALSPARISKYRLAQTALGTVPPASPRGVLSGPRPQQLICA